MGSNGWLNRWKVRNKVSQAVLTGKRGDVDKETVEDWKKSLPSLCGRHALKDIFNCDETGLYWRALPSKGMVVKANNAAGVKIKKDRVTLMLLASATGEKLPLQLIGTSKKPGAFESPIADVCLNAIKYKFNKKSVDDIGHIS